MATNEATIGALTQAVTLALADKIELEQGVTPSNSSKYGELGQVYDLFNAERGTVGTLSVVSGTATADLLSGRRSFFKMTIGDNFTLALSNVPAGASFLCIQFTTNSTGGYSANLPASFHAMAGSGVLVITTPSTVCYLRAYTVDGGVNWYYIIDAGDAGGGGGGTTPNQALLTAAIMAKSPKVYYKCNETSGSILADSSGNGKDLTLAANAVLNYGEFVENGSSFYGGSGTSGASRGDNAGLVCPINYSWSLCGIYCHISTSTSNNDILILGIGGSGETDPSNYQIQVINSYTSGARQLSLFWERGAGTDVNVAGPAMPTGESFLLGINKDSVNKVVTYFINGKATYSQSYTYEPTGGSAVTVFTLCNSLTVGAGSMSNFAIFPSLLTPADHKAIAKASGYW